MPVAALPQATDPERFRPGEPGPAHELLFVGNSRGVRRHMLDELLPTDHELAVYGRAWTADRLDPHYLAGEHVPNDELAGYYGAAAIVLNDHWLDMQREGFLSNRLYDAAAAGAFVISDDVEGLEEAFDGGIAGYVGADELRRLVDTFLADPGARRDCAERARAAVLERHTFDHRARTLLDAVEPLLAGPRDGDRRSSGGRIGPPDLRPCRVTTADPRRLVFVRVAGDAPEPDASTTVVVLDTAWTPLPDGRPDVVSLRPAASAVLAEEDLFEEALARLDAWGDDTGMPDRMLVAGVAWWFRARETEWNWLHERILWRRALGRLMSDHGVAIDGIEIPAGEPALADVVRALGGRVPEPKTDPPAGALPRGPASRAAAGARPRSLLQRIGGRIGRATGQASAATSPTTAAAGPSTPERLPAVENRKAALDDRLQWLAGGAARPVLVLSHMGIRQAIGGPDAGSHLDPNLGGVIRRIESGDRPAVVIGLGLDHRKDDDWPAIAGDQRLLPFSILSTLGGAEAPGAPSPDAAVAGLLAAIDGAPPVPLEVDGADFAPALCEQLRTFAGTIVPVALRQEPRIARLLEALAPSAILLTHEGIRTPWLAAAARRGIPTFAVAARGDLRDPPWIRPPAPDGARPAEPDVRLRGLRATGPARPRRLSRGRGRGDRIAPARPRRGRERGHDRSRRPGGRARRRSP